MNNSNQEINKQIKKEQNVVENAWKEYYLKRWNQVTKMELERIRREGI